MAKQTAQTVASSRLICPECGNTHRFIEVMAKEAHVVAGNLNYIQLFEAITDRYVCVECGLTITMR